MLKETWHAHWPGRYVCALITSARHFTFIDMANEGSRWDNCSMPHASCPIAPSPNQLLVKLSLWFDDLAL